MFRMQADFHWVSFMACDINKCQLENMTKYIVVSTYDVSGKLEGVIIFSFQKRGLDF